MRRPALLGPCLLVGVLSLSWGRASADDAGEAAQGAVEGTAAPAATLDLDHDAERELWLRLQRQDRLVRNSRRWMGYGALTVATFPVTAIISGLICLQSDPNAPFRGRDCASLGAAVGIVQVGVGGLVFMGSVPFLSGHVGRRHALLDELDLPNRVGVARVALPLLGYGTLVSVALGPFGAPVFIGVLVAATTIGLRFSRDPATPSSPFLAEVGLLPTLVAPDAPGLVLSARF